jgi:hypothetical protein
MGNEVHADIAIGAAAIVDQHWLAETLGETVGNDARYHVRSAAWRKRDNQFYRFRWVSGFRRRCAVLRGAQ